MTKPIASVLREAIDASQLTTSEYAIQVLKREPSTVYRYLRTGNIPAVVQKFLLGNIRLLETPQTEKKQDE